MIKYRYITPLALMCSLPLISQSYATPFKDDTTSKNWTDKEITNKGANLNFGGILQWDYKLNKHKYVDDMSHSGLRRSRLFVKGQLNNQWSFKTTLRLGENSKTNGDAVNAYIRYTVLSREFNVTVGKQKEPFGLERLTSSKYIPLLERSAITEYYTSQHKIGIQIQGKGSDWTYGLGLFESDDKKQLSLSNTAFTGRFTKALNIQNQLSVHLGLGFTSRKNYLNNKDVTSYNLELATIYKFTYLQSEYFHTSADTLSQVNDGYYVQLGTLINGKRSYKDGTLKKIHVYSNSGALELVVRYESGLGKYSDIELGKIDAEQISTGLNYYMNNDVRLGLSYMTGKQRGTNVNNEEYRARVQWVF